MTFTCMVRKFLNLALPEFKRWSPIKKEMKNIWRNWMSFLCSGFHLIHNDSIRNAIIK